MFHHARFLRAVASSSLGICLQSFSSIPNLPQFRRPVDILQLCVAAETLSSTQQAHAIATVNGHLPSSVSVAAVLILSYAAHNSHPSTLQSLFAQTAAHARSPFLHNTLIRGCTVLSNCPHRELVANLGILTYNDLLRDARLRPDDYSFPFVLKLCADFVLTSKGEEVHGRLIKAGFDDDVFVNNTLILFYGSCGNLPSAKKVFDEMPERDTISWNTAIRVFSDKECSSLAIDLFKGMMSLACFMPNVITVVSILPVCAGLEDEILVSLIHSYVFKVGLDREIRAGNSLVDAYGKSGSTTAMEATFREMIETNDVSWNSLIGGFSYNGLNEDSFVCFRAMIAEGVRLTTVTVATALPALVELNMFKMGKEVHGYIVRRGMDSCVFVANALIDMYGKCGRFIEASCVFYENGTRNIVSWNTMIGNFAQNGLEAYAIELVRKMQAHGEIPNSVTLTNVLPACARLSSLCHGREIHGRSMKLGSCSDLFISNALMDMYAKCSRLDLAQTVFDISPRDDVSYNILIMGYSQAGQCSNSVSLFLEMETLGLNISVVSYTGVLAACANIHAIKEGKQIHAFAVRRLFHEHCFVANSLLDLYAKCGRIDVAMSVFNQIHMKDTASWNIMILGFGMIGEFDTAINLFEAMKEGGVRYDSVSYIAVLSACSHGGLVERGKVYFDDMLARNIKPSEMHYACMVDLLGRTGLVEEAVQVINSLPIMPGTNIWGALLGASQLHGNMDLGCWAAERLLELKPDQPGYYVLLSNMYAEAGRWEEADRIRKLMTDRRVKKNPGCSWVQTQDKIHGFVAGERFNPDLWHAISI